MVSITHLFSQLIRYFEARRLNNGQCYLLCATSRSNVTSGWCARAFPSYAKSYWQLEFLRSQLLAEAYARISQYPVIPLSFHFIKPVHWKVNTAHKSSAIPRNYWRRETALVIHWYTHPMKVSHITRHHIWRWRLWIASALRNKHQSTFGLWSPQSYPIQYLESIALNGLMLVFTRFHLHICVCANVVLQGQQSEVNCIGVIGKSLQICDVDIVGNPISALTRHLLLVPGSGPLRMSYQVIFQPRCFGSFTYRSFSNKAHLS